MMHFFGVYALAVLLHLCASARAAPPTAVWSSSSAALNSLSTGLNLTTPFNTTRLNISNSTALKASNRDFPDPYDFVIGTDKLTIEFYGYQGIVDSADLAVCVGDANTDLLQKVMAGQGNTPMGMVPYVWPSGNLALYLSPGEQLTWVKWSLVPAAIGTFVVENGFKGMQFILLWHELGPIGYGHFVTMRERNPW
ncbi:MAG: hypothetical protein Q9175_006058 [Cornicularia normoerica]